MHVVNEEDYSTGISDFSDIEIESVESSDAELVPEKPIERFTVTSSSSVEVAIKEKDQLLQVLNSQPNRERVGTVRGAASKIAIQNIKQNEANRHLNSDQPRNDLNDKPSNTVSLDNFEELENVISMLQTSIGQKNSPAKPAEKQIIQSTRNNDSILPAEVDKEFDLLLGALSSTKKHGSRPVSMSVSSNPASTSQNTLSTRPVSMSFSAKLPEVVLPPVKYCNACGMYIDGIYMETGGKLYHLECAGGESCGGCRNTVVNGQASIRAIGRLWHAGCFRCNGCSKVLQEYLQRDNQILCQECYNSQLVCSECSRPILSVYFAILGKKYHPECFRCAVCRKSLPGGNFFDMAGKPTCDSCCSNSVGTCPTCGRPPEGAVIKCLGRTYHDKCFACKRCRNLLVDGYYKVGDWPFCKKCSIIQ